MFLNPFDGPRAKLERSHRHFNELRAAEAQYAKPQEVAIVLEVQPNGDTKGFAELPSLPTASHVTIVGDVINNFRAALDHAVVEACRMRGAESIAKTYFAFAGSEQDWLNNAPYRMKHADGVVRAAVQSFKPWREDGNLLLYTLNSIASGDKHYDLVALTAGPAELEIRKLKISSHDGKLARYQGCTPVWSHATPRAELFTVAGLVEIAGPCIVRPQLVFGEGHALSRKPIVPNLNEMGAICERIIDALEAAAKQPLP